MYSINRSSQNFDSKLSETESLKRRIRNLEDKLKKQRQELIEINEYKSRSKVY